MTLIDSDPAGIARDNGSKARMSGVDALIFDAGDIIYRRVARRARISALLKERGLSLPAEKEIPKDKKLAAWRGHTARSDYFRSLLLQCGFNDASRMDEAVRLMELDMYDIEFVSGVAHTLHALKRAGYRLGIVTNTHETNSEKLDWFTRIGIDGLFDAFISSYETGYVKPEPAIYLSALVELNVAPANTVFVGHSAMEIIGAKRCGMRTIAFNADEPIPEATAHARDFSDLLALVGPGAEAQERAGGPRRGPIDFPTIAAHRGGALVWPENSRTAFLGAIGLNADLIETDVHLSSDGELVIIHDSTLDRTTDGRGPVADRTLSELRNLTIRGTKSDTIMTLEELLQLIAHTNVDLRLEFKVRQDGTRYRGLEQKCIELLQRYDMLARTTFTSFNVECLTEAARLVKSAGAIALLRKDAFADGAFAQTLEKLEAAGIPEVALPLAEITPQLLAEAKAAGTRIGAYAVRCEADVRRALQIGLSTFTCDIPGAALARRRKLLVAHYARRRPPTFRAEQER